ncbi:hypothetical protein GCM10025862_40110 [Arsenicicoccus piscis]|uniref:Secreted protein n=1 Tax=Arsenicicoccus piscis TaxID=673954 RepID=A0ABQ6HWN8_9MICO|nr:hypothetical protein GCM10025862_40110 [Arsenicicoccus piscis]
MGSGWVAAVWVAVPALSGRPALAWVLRSLASTVPSAWASSRLSGRCPVAGPLLAGLVGFHGAAGWGEG